MKDGEGEATSVVLLGVRAPDMVAALMSAVVGTEEGMELGAEELWELLGLVAVIASQDVIVETVTVLATLTSSRNQIQVSFAKLSGVCHGSLGV